MLDDLQIRLALICSTGDYLRVMHRFADLTPPHLLRGDPPDVKSCAACLRRSASGRLRGEPDLAGDIAPRGNAVS